MTDREILFSLVISVNEMKILLQTTRDMALVQRMLDLELRYVKMATCMEIRKDVRYIQMFGIDSRELKHEFIRKVCLRQHEKSNNKPHSLNLGEQIL